MRILVVSAVLAGAVPAFAQVRVEVVAPPPPRVVVRAPAPPPPVVVAPPPPAVRVAAPTVRFAAPPPLVVVEPGVQVVQDSDDEIFFVDGWYWHHGPNGWWYRTRSYRGGWVAVPPRAVPARLVRLPPGHYRHWHGDARWREHREEKMERREAKWAEKERERQARALEKQREHEEHGRGHGHGHGRW